MLHEGDLSERGANGKRVIWIEHFRRRKVDPGLADVYENCLLSCAECNTDRGTKPNVDGQRGTLLDPTKVAWAERFVWDGPKLQPRPGDADAEYTWLAYKLNSPEKLERRRSRPELIEAHQVLLSDLADLIMKLGRQTRAAARAGNDPKALEKLDQARKRQQIFETVATQLRRFTAIPKDHPPHCQCGHGADMTLPPWLARQIQSVLLPDAPVP
jgi:hypothetical protein